VPVFQSNTCKCPGIDQPGLKRRIMNSAPATRARHLWRALCATALLPLFTAGCWHGPTARSNSAVVTFRVADETFRALLVGDGHIEAARAAQAGGSARIPNGRIVRGTGVNSGWSWHLEDVEFVEVSIELCDGRPSDVEPHGPEFGGGRFCPWTAQVVAVRTN
jgi:hypothetical protein